MLLDNLSNDVKKKLTTIYKNSTKSKLVSSFFFIVIFSIYLFKFDLELHELDSFDSPIRELNQLSIVHKYLIMKDEIENLWFIFFIIIILISRFFFTNYTPFLPPTPITSSEISELARSHYISKQVGAVDALLRLHGLYITVETLFPHTRLTQETERCFAHLTLQMTRVLVQFVGVIYLFIYLFIYY